MSLNPYRIPATLNLLIAAGQLSALLGLIWLAGQCTGWPALLLVALAYGLVMNSAYAMLHEAEHGMAHPHRGINTAIGVVLALFFPAPFHLIRQGHLGHHMRNRSDDEAFDFYFEGESPVWKYLQFYGILTGLFWLVVVASNAIALLAPRLLRPGKQDGRLDRPTEALLASLNGRYARWIRLEAALVFALHGCLSMVWRVPLSNYAVTLAGFGVIWSALQYVHHYNTERDVLKGARNLRSWRWLDVLWLNHNWHLNHHMKPTVPWIYLPQVGEGEAAPRGGLLAAYLAMWRGPRLTHERVENRYEGRIIQ